MAVSVKAGQLGIRTKWQLVVGVFVLCWVLYFLVPCFQPKNCFSRISDLFESEAYNFIFLMVLFMIVSVLSVDAADYLYLKLRRLPWFRPRLGEILVYRGFITQEELQEALDEQRLRTGEVLVRAGRITPLELEHALDYQRTHAGKKIGEVLVELGYSSHQDIDWALYQINRKLGKVLMERGLISEFDLHRILGRMWYGRNRGL